MSGNTSHLIGPLAWLLLLVSLYFSSDRRGQALKRGGFDAPKNERPPLPHGAFGLLSCAKLLATLGILLTASSLLHTRTAHILSATVGWLAFGVVIGCSYVVAAEIIRDAMEPMPNLARPTILLLRWLGSLMLGVVLLADLPLLPLDHLRPWLVTARVCCTLCVLILEVSLAGLLLSNLRLLGLFVRSRSVGLALGLTTLGFSDLFYALGAVLHGVASADLRAAGTIVLLVAVAVWAFFILAPDRERLPHKLNARGLLMTWKELAPQIAVNLRPSEKTPFIAGIEARVQSVLAKYGVETGAQ